jgi:hypothetical protein
MIDAISNNSGFSVLWQYVGPLIGVGLGYLISLKVWDRQKQWEMRRDVIFEVVRSLGELDNSLSGLHVEYCLSIPNNEGSKEEALVKRNEKRDDFISCHTKINSARFLADMVIGDKFDAAISECLYEMRSIAEKIIDGDTSCYLHAQKALGEKIRAVNQGARRELRLKNAE